MVPVQLSEVLHDDLLIPHFLGAAPTSVAIVGLGPSEADFFYIVGQHTPPTVFDEVWTMNTGIRYVPHDLAFVMDDMLEFGRRYPAYHRSLATHTKPIAIGAVYSEYPAAVEYPINAILDRCPGQVASFHHNSVPYLLAYALAIGVERVTLFGCDYSYPISSRREEGQAVAALWIGYLRGRGVSVGITESSSLLETHRLVDDPLFRPYYGYLRAPAVPGVTR